jgi:hypothetical protein
MDTAAVEDYPSWSPDGSQIVFVSDQDNDDYLTDLYVMNADGSDIRRLTEDARHTYAPVWSPDGSQIVFISDRDSEDYAFELYLIQADGTDLRRLTTNTVVDRWPFWRPAVPLPACLLVFDASVNVRSGPGTSYDLLGTTSSGQQAVPTGISADGAWWQFSFEEHTAWVSASLAALRVIGACKDIPVIE